MSAQGLRQTDEGVEKIASREELAEVQRRGRRALLGSVVATFAATVPFVVVV